MKNTGDFSVRVPDVVRLPWPRIVVLLGLVLAALVVWLGELARTRDRLQFLEAAHRHADSVAQLLWTQVQGAERVLVTELELVDSLLLEPVRQEAATAHEGAGVLPAWSFLSTQLRQMRASTPHLRSLSVVNRAGDVLASSHPSNVGMRLVWAELGLSTETGRPLQLGRLQWWSDWHFQRVAGATPERQPSLLLRREVLPVGGDPLFLLALVAPDYLGAIGDSWLPRTEGYVWIADAAGTVLSSGAHAPVVAGQVLNGPFLPSAQPGEGAGGVRRTRGAVGDGAAFVHHLTSPEANWVVGVAMHESTLLQRWASRQAGARWWAAGLAGLITATAALMAHTLHRYRQSDAHLKASREALQASNDARNAFVANISHEIRTPIGVILGMTELALDSAPGPEVQQHLQAVRQASLRLRQLLDRVLDYAKLQAGVFPLAQAAFALRSWCREQEAAWAPPAQARGVDLVWRVDPDVPERVRGDADRLRQIVDTLLDNALRFTPSGGRVEVAVERLSFHQCVYRLGLSVTDTGPGMTPALARAVFEGFVQADGSTTRTHSGVGLSLALARQLARRMGGDVQLQPHPGPGACLRVTCDLAEADEADPAAATAAPPALPAAGGGGPVRVLSVDDIGVNQKIVSLVLQRLGCRVDTAANGVEAVERCLRERFDLVLMDLQMPLMDGLEACRRIRAHEATSGTVPGVPILAVTAHGDLTDQAECLAAGMQGFMNKPISPAGVAAVLARHTHWRPPAPEA